MPNFAIYESNEIINVIVAESKETAELATGLNAIPATNGLWIGWTLEEEGWRSPKPYPSWSWDGEMWVAPIPRPLNGIWEWNEEFQEWEEIIPLNTK